MLEATREEGFEGGVVVFGGLGLEAEGGEAGEQREVAAR